MRCALPSAMHAAGRFPRSARRTATGPQADSPRLRLLEENDEERRHGKDQRYDDREPAEAARVPAEERFVLHVDGVTVNDVDGGEPHFASEPVLAAVALHKGEQRRFADARLTAGLRQETKHGQRWIHVLDAG